MSALTMSCKRDASSFLADPDRLISKRVRLGVRLCPTPEPPPPPPTSLSSPSAPASSSVNSEVEDNFPTDGEQWAEVFVKEMAKAFDVNDAKNRAFRMLEVFEKSIKEYNVAEAMEAFQVEHSKLKEQMESLLYENGILKKAVTIQHERLKEYGDKVKELDGLKQTLSQYQEKIRTLELNNYALAMHLKRSQENSPIQGHFNRDVF
ncbi:hypothetical protein LUZ63_003394 [Rhynchospora breviuscula]|uniref:Uncharacterized protein n=1 Tax=Rhynchospora breviuscula TaxID=2022672 RepID=A0A9Q0D0J0_9POAL|nr:hypothetical protein LUZ63_003394 [Rhynchospora breviuscula]